MPGIDILLLLVTGIGVGLAQGVLGVGGGFIMVPVLVALFQRQGLPIDMAIPLAFGSSLLVIFTTAVSSSWAHHRERDVWWKAAVVMGITGAAGAAVGSTLTSQVISGEVMKFVFGAVVILAGLRMLLWTGPKSEKGKPQENPIIWLAWGFPTGVIVGLIGIGGGIIAVPIMVTIFRFTMHRAVGTSNGMMLFSASAGALGYVLNGLGAPDLPEYSVGYINLLAWICLAATSVAAAQIGTRLGHRLTEQVVKVLFVLLMFYIGLEMLGVFG